MWRRSGADGVAAVSLAATAVTTASTIAPPTPILPVRRGPARHLRHAHLGRPGCSPPSTTPGGWDWNLRSVRAMAFKALLWNGPWFHASATMNPPGFVTARGRRGTAHQRRRHGQRRWGWTSRIAAGTCLLYTS